MNQMTEATRAITSLDEYRQLRESFRLECPEHFNFGLDVVLLAFLLLVPFALVGASLMTLVASFTKSFKEAQTWVSVVLLAPTMPILVVSILQVRPSTELMFIPSLSQHLLLVDLIRNEPMNLLHVAVSVIGTLTVGGILTWICARLYRREGLLG